MLWFAWLTVSCHSSVSSFGFFQNRNRNPRIVESITRSKRWRLLQITRKPLIQSFSFQRFRDIETIKKFVPYKNLVMWLKCLYPFCLHSYVITWYEVHQLFSQAIAMTSSILYFLIEHVLIWNKAWGISLFLRLLVLVLVRLMQVAENNSKLQKTIPSAVSGKKVW